MVSRALNNQNLVKEKPEKDYKIAEEMNYSPNS